MEGALTVKKKVLLTAAALLAVLVLAGLWHIRPRSWESLFGTAEVQNLSGQISLFTLDNRGVHIDSWSLTPTQAEGAAAQAIMDALRSGSYRAKLVSLLPGRYNALGAGSVHLAVNFDGAQWVTVSVGGITVVPPLDGNYAFFLQIADTMLYDAKRHGRNQVVWADEQLKQMWEKQDPASGLRTTG